MKVFPLFYFKYLSAIIVTSISLVLGIGDSASTQQSHSPNGFCFTDFDRRPQININPDILPTAINVYGVTEVDLFYYRDTSRLAELLTVLTSQNGKDTSGCFQSLESGAPLLMMANSGMSASEMANPGMAAEDGDSETPSQPPSIPDDFGQSVGRDRSPGAHNTIFIYGTESFRRQAARLVVAIDRPVPSVNLQVWGIQVSGDDAEDMASLMIKIREEVGNTRSLIQQTMGAILQFSRSIERDQRFGGVNQQFRFVLDAMGYQQSTEVARPTGAITDLISTGIFINHPREYFIEKYDFLENMVYENPEFDLYVDALRQDDEPFLLNVYTSRGFRPRCVTRDSREGYCIDWTWDEIVPGSALAVANASRRAHVELALANYERIVNPETYNPFVLQAAHDRLNARLADASAAINADLEAFFIRPTLREVQRLVANENDVEFALVGRTTLSTLSGETVSFSSNSTSIFDVTPQIPISTLISDMEGTISRAITSGGVAAGLAILDNAITAVEEQERLYRNVRTGNSLIFQANVLRESSFAELDIELLSADPVFSPTQDGVPDVSRIGQQHLDTTVNIQAVDFFDLATMSNQASLEGGRYTIPLLGHIWQAFFGAIPGFGDLFTLQNDPRNVLHETLMLTNAYITPTSESIVLANTNEYAALEAEIYAYDDTITTYTQLEQRRRQIYEQRERNYCITHFLVDDYLAEMQGQEVLSRVRGLETAPSRIVLDPIDSTKCSDHFNEYIHFRNTQLVDWSRPTIEE